jgi:uncharacterized protein YbjT (DUF2867 family)
LDPGPGHGPSWKPIDERGVTMKVFITGGSGYIGRAVIEALVRRDIAVTALVRGDAAARAVTERGAAPVRGALTDLDVLREAARASDGVIHLGQHYGEDTAEVDRAASASLQDGAGRGRTCTPAGSGCTATPAGSWTRTRRCGRRV